MIRSSTIALQIASNSWRGADAQLEPGGLAAGQLAHPGDEPHQLARRVENTLWPGGLTHVSPFGTARALAISSVTLAAGQHAADARLGALAELQRDAS